jgi:hypothetical protein
MIKTTQKIMIKQILEEHLKNMGIKTMEDYVKFYTELKMQGSVSFLSFINNEKNVLKHKIENKNSDRDSILRGIVILEKLHEELKDIGEQAILEKYKDKYKK